jgi:hypothetical protein
VLLRSGKQFGRNCRALRWHKSGYTPAEVFAKQPCPGSPCIPTATNKTRQGAQRAFTLCMTRSSTGSSQRFHTRWYSQLLNRHRGDLRSESAWKSPFRCPVPVESTKAVVMSPASSIIGQYLAGSDTMTGSLNVSTGIPSGTSAWLLSRGFRKSKRASRYCRKATSFVYLPASLIKKRKMGGLTFQNFGHGRWQMRTWANDQAAFTYFIAPTNYCQCQPRCYRGSAS